VHERIDPARGVIGGEDRVIIQGYRLPPGAGHVLIRPPAPTVISTGLRESLMRQRSVPSSCVAAPSPCRGRLKINSSTLSRASSTSVSPLLNKDETGRVVIAGGPWKGEPWSEAGMVHPQLGRIGFVRCAILDLNAQIEVKRMMPIWVPGRPRRAERRRRHRSATVRAEQSQVTPEVDPRRVPQRSENSAGVAGGGGT
jgi:hypothetical protein